MSDGGDKVGTRTRTRATRGRSKVTRRKTRTKQAIITTSVLVEGDQMNPDKDNKEEVFPIPVADLPEHVAIMKLDGGVTKNMGNFNSVKVLVGAEWPCEPTIEAAERTLDFLSELVDRRCAQELSSVIGKEASADTDDDDDMFSGTYEG